MSAFLIVELTLQKLEIQLQSKQNIYQTSGEELEFNNETI